MNSLLFGDNLKWLRDKKPFAISSKFSAFNGNQLKLR